MLIVEAGTEPADRYTMETVLPPVDEAALRSAPASVPPAIALNLELPDDVPASWRAEARAAAAGAANRYDAARRLQRHLLDGPFAWTGPAEGRLRPLVNDVLEGRRGTSEQFASAYAVLARSVGVPTRIVVGFLPGTRRADGTWVVNADDQHAWAEVWFEGAGWVPFEVTPRPGTLPLPVP
jgi:transglutaminase-like putative cysteine protease